MNLIMKCVQERQRGDLKAMNFTTECLEIYVAKNGLVKELKGSKKTIQSPSSDNVEPFL